MRVLVAGGTGFVGTHLCTELNDRGHEVTALARDPDSGDLPSGVETAVGDVTAYDSIVGHVDGQDAVVNLVALSPLFQPPENTTHERVHLGGTENLVRAAEAADVDRFVQMSGLGAHPHAKTAHLRAKGRAEAVVTDSDLAWTIFRPSVVFGEDAEFLAFTKLVTTPYLTALPGGGKTRFQPIWVDDLVGILADGAGRGPTSDRNAASSGDAVEDGDHTGEIYEIGGPDVLTLAEVTELVYEAEGRSVTVLPIPMALAKLGLTAMGPIPFVPFGPDQARGLEVDNTVAENDVAAFGLTEADLTTLPAYLGLESDRSTVR